MRWLDGITYSMDVGLSELQEMAWVFSICGASVGFLTRYDGELREPLMWRQGSQVSMRMAWGACHCSRAMVGALALGF